MPYRPPGPRTPGLPHALWLSVLITSTTLAPVDAGAQAPPPERNLRFTEELKLQRGSLPLSLSVYQRAYAEERIWNVELASGAGRTSAICRTTLPEDVGQSFYRFDVQTRELDGQGHALLLQALADEGRGPLDPPVFQIAMWMKPSGSPSGWSCGVIGRGEFTRLDGGSSMAFRSLELDDDQTPTLALVRSGTSRGARFCGLQREEDRGFEVFDPSQGRFVAGDRIDLRTDDAIPLDATLPPRPLHAPMTTNVFSWTLATSDVRGAPVGGLPARPISLGDGDLMTAWIEGSGDGGAGEYVSANVTTAVPVRALRLFPGHGRSPDHFEGYARPTELLIGLSDGLRFNVNIPSLSQKTLFEAGGLLISFPEPVYTNCLSAMILASEPGTMARGPEAERRRLGRSVAIAELTPITSIDAESEADTARNIVREVTLEPRTPRRDQLSRMTGRLPDATIAAVAEVLATDDAQARDRVVPMLATLPSASAVPLLVNHLGELRPEAADYRATQRALAAHGNVAAGQLINLLERLDPAERHYVDVVRLIGRLGSREQLEQLIAGFGQGPDRLRRERARAVAGGGLPMLPRLFAAVDANLNRPAGDDALNALGLIARRNLDQEPAQNVDGVDVLRRVAEASQVRRHRLRAIDALRFFLHPEGVSLLADNLLASDPDPLIRAAAAEALVNYPGDRPRHALEHALQDPSPDVRIAAIGALAGRYDAEQATPSVIAYVSREQWHTGLHRALGLLAASHHPEALPFLETTILATPNSEQAPIALRALRNQERPLSRSAIDELLILPGLRPSVLRQLVSMLGLIDEPGVEYELISIAQATHLSVTTTSTDDPSLADELRRQALFALGARRNEPARDFLLTFVEDDTGPEDLRVVALRALAFFADPLVQERLQAMASGLPLPLRPQLRDTLRQIQGRLAIDTASDDLDQLRESMEQRQQERHNAPPTTDPAGR
ncbi:hypothetical protein DL240_05215 [Lujinxingia litoralis]|uniref:HEAT repeat domain-containing protein n=1 Tax=Lujinxingia litoralis TaxID=2211119 RepID=A0A328C7N1_9DELT|nr:HEAT repeat domain-containing protein [Lujinxingia litoralis]RAL23560.1 hypothetical protein DL240_05215 [Lujinxingia litoralis]